MPNSVAPLILVIDDTEVNRYTVTRNLQAAGFRTQEAATADEGLHLATKRPDLIVLDVQLPELSGYEVCARLRQDPTTDAIPILMTSAAFTAGGDRAHGLETGADGYLVTPIDPTELVATVRMLLRTRDAERKARDSEARLRLALEASDTGMWTWNLKSDAVTWSPECYRIHGLRSDEFDGTASAFFRLVHPDDRQHVEETVRSAIRERMLYTCEFRILKPDGMATWVENRGRAAYAGDGSPLEMLGTITAIDARKQMEAALRESEERFRQALAAAKMDAFDWNVTTDRVERALGKELLLGEDPEALGNTGREYFECVHGDDRPRLVSAIDALTRNDPELTIDYRLTTPAGNTVWFRDTARGEFSPEGKLRHLRGVTSNITDIKHTEELLAAADERFEFVRKSSGVGFWYCDLPFDVLNWDEQVRAHFHLSEAGPVTLNTFYERIHEEDRERVRLAIATAIESRAPYDIEYRTVNPDKSSERWIRAMGRTSYGPEGNPLRFDGVTIDVSNQKETESALRDREERLRLALEAAEQGAWSYYPATGLIELDARARELWGLGPDGCVHYSCWLEAVHQEDRPRVEAAVHRVLGGSARGRLALEHRVVSDGDGGERWIALTAHISSDSQKTPRLIGTVQDITPRKRAEESLRRRERELTTLADNTPDILTRLDRQMRHVFVNSAVERATGVRREVFLGKTNRELGMPPELCDRWEQQIRGVFDDGQPCSFEFSFAGPSRSRRYAARFVPEFGRDGKVEYALGVTQDVTERHRYEEALRDEDRRKNEFLATLAHELRNPLAPIRNGLQLLRAMDLTDEAHRVRDVMERQLSHMVRLVDDLLDVSRISKGRIDLRREIISLQSVLDHALEATRPVISLAGHELHVELLDAPIWVDGDLTRLAQVVGNLLTNAAKYTPEGGRITLSAAAEGEFAVVRVKDNGTGIPREMLPVIFDLFTQLDENLGRAQGGLGIGLSLVRTLVDMHGGTVAADSSGPGEGSIFTVRLPLAESPAVSDNGAERVTTARSVGSRSRLRVLVVDDNVDAAITLAMLVEMLGHEAHVAHTGRTAVAAAQKVKPDLVFLDIGLPEMDGYEVCRRVRDDDDLAGTTLVALTGWGTEEDRRRAHAAGFNAHLVKPVNYEDVERVLSGLPTLDIAPASEGALEMK